jgi:ParG protein
MATPQPGPAQKLIELLEGLPATDRKQITAWLLGLQRGTPALSFGAPATPTNWTSEVTVGRLHQLLPRLASALPAGEESQLVTIRLPAERHTQLRTWCAEHGFTMASVVRGLVERFLEEQAPPAKTD